jgi:CubicO group peptidase (beta-lactamase class C family)
MKLIGKKLVGIVVVLMIIQISLNAQDTLNYIKIEKSVDKYLNYFSDNNPGAVISVIKDGNIIFKKAYGLSNVQTGEKMSKNQTFNIGELSKSFTAIAIMQLVEDSKINLDDNVNDILDNFPEYGKKLK